MRLVFAPIVALLLVVSPALADSYADLFPDLAANADYAEANEMLQDLDFQRGKVTLSNGVATLDTGAGFYFLGPEDSRYVLEKLWGNPPGDSVLGMIFPADKTPLHDTWGAVLSYDEMGHVSDKDAASYDYDKLLKQMQDDAGAANAEREKAGYERIELVGWAEPPHYDAASRKLYWAKELKFGETDEGTLNYNIRALGRKGVLVTNVVAGMDLLGEVRAAAPELIAMTDFTDGNRYGDFLPDVDPVSAVGIGGLVAGTVAAAKPGLVVAALLLLKKGFILLLIPLYWLKNLFKRKRSD